MHERFKHSFQEMTRLTKVDDFKADVGLIVAHSAIFWAYSVSLTTKFGVNFVLYYNTLRILGTERHEQFRKDCEEVNDVGCFALTELGHGSNVKGLQTTATYDRETDEFVLNTPEEKGMKFWIGGAAKVSNVSCTWAQLYIDGECKGVHAFIVPLRDRRRHMPLPGITVGDCGKKLGNDAIDNGFIMFKDVRIPRKNLLNRFSDIVDGKFVSNYDNDDRRFAVSLGALSGGRISLAFGSQRFAFIGLSIALRYACVRK